jgi:hypothetical protein
MRELKISKGGLGMQVGASFTPMQFLSPTKAFTVAADGNAAGYDHYAARAGEPAHLECFVGEVVASMASRLRHHPATAPR